MSGNLNTAETAVRASSPVGAREGADKIMDSKIIFSGNGLAGRLVLAGEGV